MTTMNAVSKICLSSALLGKLHGNGGKGHGMFLSYFFYSTSRQFQIQRISQSLNSINLHNLCENQYFCVKKCGDKRGGKGKSYTKIMFKNETLLLLEEIVEALVSAGHKIQMCNLLLKVFGNGGRKAPGGKSEQWQPSS